jgi:hypothetical protein
MRWRDPNDTRTRMTIITLLLLLVASLPALYLYSLYASIRACRTPIWTPSTLRLGKLRAFTGGYNQMVTTQVAVHLPAEQNGQTKCVPSSEACLARFAASPGSFCIYLRWRGVDSVPCFGAGGGGGGGGAGAVERQVHLRSAWSGRIAR